MALRGAECDIPYPGAKEHYILDIENRELPDQVIPLLVAATPPPKDKQRGGLHSTEQSRGQRPRLVFAVSGREKGEKEKESEDVTKKSNQEVTRGVSRNKKDKPRNRPGTNGADLEREERLTVSLTLEIIAYYVQFVNTVLQN